MRLLGIDPGLRTTGYGCVEHAAANPRSAPTPPRLVEAGIIRLNARTSISDRLAELDTDLASLLDRLRPDAVAVEKLYAHYAHPTTAIIMGHARGVLLLCIHRSGAPLVELGATEVKKSITGNGHASKRQMQNAVRNLMSLKSPLEPADIADAIAIALCALRRAKPST